MKVYGKRNVSDFEDLSYRDGYLTEKRILRSWHIKEHVNMYLF